MILDGQNQYSDAQAFSGAGAVVSTNVIDHGQDRDIGIGEPMAVVVNTTVAPDNGDGDETYVVDLQVAIDEAFTVPVVIATLTIDRDDAVNRIYALGVPADSSFLRFSRLNVTLAGTTPSITIDAHLIPQSGIENFRDYPDNVTITS